MWGDLLNMPCNNLLQPLVGTDDMFHRNARHREAIRDFLRCLINIHIIFQPLNGNLHTFASLELM